MRLSAKLCEEVVCVKSRHHDGSAASTVAGSTGSGGSTENFAVRVVQNTFVASRIELAVGETFAAVVLHWTRPSIEQGDLDVLDWDLTDRDQGNFDIKMMVFLCVFQQALAGAPIKFRDVNVRATLELDLEKRL